MRTRAFIWLSACQPVYLITVSETSLLRHTCLHRIQLSELLFDPLKACNNYLEGGEVRSGASVGYNYTWAGMLYCIPQQGNVFITSSSHCHQLALQVFVIKS